MGNILYFIGAGASRAISSRIPITNDFLEKVIDNFESAEDFIVVDALMEAVKTGVLNAPRQTPLAGRTRDELLNGSKFEQCKEWCKSVVGTPNNSQGEPIGLDLESCFERAEKIWAQGGSAAPFQKLTQLIGWLFSKLDRKLAGELSFEDNPYKVLARELAHSGDRHTHYFVSFNYEIWLERELFNIGKWVPRDGYDRDNDFNRFAGYLTLEDQIKSREGQAVTIQQFRRRMRGLQCRIFKPHGSLSWVRPEEEFYSKPAILLNDIDSLGNEFKGAPTYLLNGQKIEKVKLTGEEKTYVPFVIPPNPTKVKAGSLLWNLQKEIDEKIEGIDNIVVIGWSLPDVDVDMARGIERIIAGRNRQVKNLLICNLEQTLPFYSKFEQLFWPENKPEFFDLGFSKKFIEENLKRLYQSI